ncbi:MAG: PilZ domain-containing protein, partial [bacterium]
MSPNAPNELRRTRRSPIENLFTTIEFGGREYRAQVTDVSEGGMCLILTAPVDLSPKESVKISIDDVVPSIRGKIRWVADNPEAKHQKLIGIQFESLEIRALDKSGFEGELDLPIESPLSKDALGRFLGILEGIDHKIIDGEIEDLSEAAA